MSETNAIPNQSGVEDLVQRLRADGIAAGKREAEEIVVAAQQQAHRIVDEARREADEILERARAEATRRTQSGIEDLQLASRDALLKLRESFEAEFEHQLSVLVGRSLADDDFLKKLILEIARAASTSSDDPKLHFLVAGKQSVAPESAGVQSAWDAFVQDLGGELVRQGITFGTDETRSAGIRVQWVDQDVELDLSDETLSRILMRFISPRLREILAEHS